MNSGTVVCRKINMPSMVMYILAVVSFLGMLFLGYLNTRQQDCLEQYAQADAAAARERLRAQEHSATALDDLVTEVLGSTTAEQTREALEHYLEARAEEKKKREENPIPDSPDRFCD